jgi:succinyl-diaminopimelate desuccinylase
MPAAGTARDWMLDRLETLCADDTTTGGEDRGLPALQDMLGELGADVELQQVATGRNNVFAAWSARPKLLFSTHLDTVPPYLPPRRSGDTLHGRGACDAKGQITCQLAAIRALLAAGNTDVAWLGVVGEETDSIGARKAMAFADRCGELIGVIDGEPTENVLATGQRGTLHLRLGTHGVPAHSGTPELGRSALWELVDWLQRLRAEPGRRDPELGREIWNLGTLHGGAAPNVIAPEAAAELFVRTLPGCTFEQLARRLAPDGADVERLGHCEPDRYPELPGFAHATVPFGSDAPRLRQLASDRTVVLVGPGSIKLAHSFEERIDGAELVAGRELLLRIADVLLQRRAVR